MEEVFLTARGHPNITARHKTAMEITCEEHLNKTGDCIIAVGADRGLKHFPQSFKKLARSDRAEITLTLEVGGIKEVITGRGHSALSFEHPGDIVVRKSTFTCPRTLIVKADKAAIDIPREMVEMLHNPEARLRAQIKVERKE